MPTIDLNNYRTANSKVFAGRDRGAASRVRAKLDQLDLNEEPITIIIPSDIFSINSSFFLGMFGDSIRALGKDTFVKKYIFSGKNIDKVIEDSIRVALQNKGPFS